MFPRTLAPLLLILLGVTSAAGVAFGCDPAVSDWLGGLWVLRAMHRLQWLLIGLTVLSGLGLAALVTFERRRAWWLLGLLPVVGLFGWRFGTAADRLSLWVEDQPAFASAAQSAWLGDDDLVIGVEVEGQAYAYPLPALRRAPVVVQSDRARRLMVAWSAGANCASAVWVDRVVRGRDLEVVAAPAGVLLVYNRRLGVFFDALTLRDPARRPAAGLGERLPTTLVPWGQWRTARPETLVLQPRFPPARDNPETVAAEPVALICTAPPIALSLAAISDQPLNVSSGPSAALLFREPDGRLRAFDRRVDGDLFPRFSLQTDRRTGRATLLDADTGSTWGFDGIATAGPMEGKRLAPLIVQPGVSAAAVRYWAPDAVWGP